jgi:UDP-N-acetylmuramate--alanine ligase
VSEIYGAREEPQPGVSGKLIVDSLAERRPGMRIAWAPELEDAARLLARWARPLDLVLTMGAGDVDRAGPLVFEALR